MSYNEMPRGLTSGYLSVHRDTLLPMVTVYTLFCFYIIVNIWSFHSNGNIIIYQAPVSNEPWYFFIFLHETYNWISIHFHLNINANEKYIFQ